ncbi:unknown [Acidaminococcus sp. CAG:917]|nr:unknown [Acidaminococcus sp. CAG:917]
MKKHILSVVALVLIVTAISLVFVACDNPLAPTVGNNSQKSVTVYLLAPDCNAAPQVLKSFDVTTTSASAHELLLQLKSENKIAYGFNDSSYGAYITSLGYYEGDTLVDMTYDVSSQFISVYHSIDRADLIDYSQFSKFFSFDGFDFKSSYVGISSLPVENGEAYAFMVNTFSW